MSDGEGAHEVIAAIAQLKRFGFTERDLAEVCMIPGLLLRWKPT